MTDFLKDQSLINALIFAVAALSGQLLHAVKKWSDGEAWLLANPRRTIGACIGNLTAIAGFITSGTIDGMKLAQLIFLGVFMGLSADSVLNKGARAEWTPEQRAAATKKSE